MSIGVDSSTAARAEEGLASTGLFSHLHVACQSVLLLDLIDTVLTDVLEEEQLWKNPSVLQLAS